MNKLYVMEGGQRREFTQDEYADHAARTLQMERDAAQAVADALAEYMQEFRDLRRELLNVLAGIALAEDLQPEFKTLRQQLLDIPQLPAVAAATTAEEARTAIKTEYARLVMTASPVLVTAFRELDQ